jgi:hypothetical protein
MRELIQQCKRTRYLVAAVALASTGLLGGCSGASNGSGNPVAASVASLRRSTTSAGAATPSPRPTAVEGPLIRYDTSEVEITRMRKVYNTCLKRQGIVMQEGKEGISQDPETLTRYKDELAACESKRPEDFPEREKRKNPEAFQEHLAQQIRCMRRRGQDVVAIPPDGWGISDRAAARGYTPDFRVVKKCQQDAFGG